MTKRKKDNPFALPQFLRIIGPKHIEAAKGFIPTIACYTGALIILGSYICDWREVLQYMPYYNSKYPKDEEEK